MKTIPITEPEDLSPGVAQLYRSRNEQKGLGSNRLSVGSFILMDPWLTLATRSVPFWMVFDAEASDRFAEQVARDEAAANSRVKFECLN